MRSMISAFGGSALDRRLGRAVPASVDFRWSCTDRFARSSSKWSVLARPNPPEGRDDSLRLEVARRCSMIASISFKSRDASLGSLLDRERKGADLCRNFRRALDSLFGTALFRDRDAW